jgi:hypothetical protein
MGARLSVDVRPVRSQDEPRSIGLIAMAYLEANNPKNHPQGVFTAHLGLISFNIYLGSYENAVIVLYKEIAEGRETPDSLVYPLVFMMRHSLELAYKWTLLGLSSFLNEPYNPGKDLHSLRESHKTLKAFFNEACKRLRVKIEEFDDRYRDAERILEFFDGLDPKGFAFRYPTDKKRRHSSFMRGKQINLLDLKNRFDSAMVLVRHTLDVIGQHIPSEEAWHKKMW